MQDGEAWRLRPRAKPQFETAREQLKTEKDPVKREVLRLLAKLHEREKIHLYTETQIAEEILGATKAQWLYLKNAAVRAKGNLASKVKTTILKKFVEHGFLKSSDLVFIITGEEKSDLVMELEAKLKEFEHLETFSGDVVKATEKAKKAFEKKEEKLKARIIELEEAIRVINSVKD